jgi:hypothetical protein
MTITRSGDKMRGAFNLRSDSTTSLPVSGITVNRAPSGNDFANLTSKFPGESQLRQLRDSTAHPILYGSKVFGEVTPMREQTNAGRNRSRRARKSSDWPMNSKRADQPVRSTSPVADLVLFRPHSIHLTLCTSWNLTIISSIVESHFQWKIYKLHGRRDQVAPFVLGMFGIEV